MSSKLKVFLRVEIRFYFLTHSVRDNIDGIDTFCVVLQFEYCNTRVLPVNSSFRPLQNDRFVNFTRYRYLYANKRTSDEK